MTPERIRSSYDEMDDMGMKALVEEAAANSGGSAGAGKDWGHEEIRQCAWWLVALATLLEKSPALLALIYCVVGDSLVSWSS